MLISTERPHPVSADPGRWFPHTYRSVRGADNNVHEEVTQQCFLSPNRQAWTIPSSIKHSDSFSDPKQLWPWKDGGLGVHSALVPIKSLVFVMPTLAPSSLSFTCTVSNGLFLFVCVHPPDNRRGLRHKLTPNGLGSQILALGIPNPQASLKWVPPRGFRSTLCFLHAQMIHGNIGVRGFSTTGKTLSVLQQRQDLKHLGKLPTNGQRQVHEFIPILSERKRKLCLWKGKRKITLWGHRSFTLSHLIK